MDFLSIFFIAVSLSSDAFAVSVTNGMLIKNIRMSHALKFGWYFGVAQLLMTVLGFLFGSAFSQYITTIDHWLAFGLLSLIGGKMLYESFKNDSENETISQAEILSFKNMLVLAIATSIDALAVGISFAFINANLAVSAVIIGVVTFIFCTLGALLGHKLGGLFKVYAERAGGLILIGIGVKILIEHLMA